MSTACKSRLPEPLTECAPLYDIHRSYQDNCDQGPFFEGELPVVEGPKQPISFLGHQLNSPLGVAAGPLLNSRWVALAAKLGFDLLTYKTIRSHAHPSHPLPNVAFVDADAPLRLGALPECLRLREHDPARLSQLSITNSFGNPTQPLDYLAEDIPRAKAALGPGQLLVVSVVGTPSNELSIEQDFAQAAAFAVGCGAQVIEANFSCPNVKSADGTLYQDSHAAEQTCRAIRKAIGNTPLIIKVGPQSDPSALQATLMAIAAGGANAVCGINTISMPVTQQDGRPSLGPDRPTSGICGATIRQTAVEWTRAAAAIIAHCKLDLALIGCGGVVEPQHFNEHLQAGADVVLTATGMMWDPYLAHRYHRMMEKTDGQ